MSELCFKAKICSNNPAHSCVFEPPNSELFEKFILTPPLGRQILPLFEDSKIDLDVVEDITVSNTPPWSQPYFSVCNQVIEDCTNPAIYKQAFLEIT